jgi:hypothetical protein
VLSGGGCGSNSGGGGAGADSPAGVVIGPLDHHCVAGDGGLIIQTIGVCDVIDSTTVPANAASCNVTFDEDAGTAGGDVDAGAATTSDYGATMYGSAGNDDDCKYYVSWTATPIKEKADTYFTVTALRLADMTPATCAGIRPDVSLNISHGVPAPMNPSPEIAPGIYKVGPVPFDAPGIWTVRFHLFEECDDGPDDSPHGHAAFYVQVP